MSTVFTALKNKVIVVFIFLSLTLFGNILDLNHIIKNSAPFGSSIGVYFIDADSGAVIFAKDEHFLLVPASLAKIVTTTTAWEILGPDFRYTTTVYVPYGSISPALRGNIVIKGNGDPSISIDVLKENLTKFVREGVKEITGDIIVDNSFFSRELWNPTWEWDYKNPAIDALILKENTNSFDPKDVNSVAINFGLNVKKVLEGLGVKVKGGYKVGKLTADYREFIVIKSAPLKNLISVANKYSSNSYAEQIHRTLGLRVYGTGSVSNSQKVVTNYLKTLFGEYYHFRLYDGCGLSASNLATSYMITQLIAYAYQNYGGLDGFISTLAVSGKEGTMEKRLGDIKLFAKTGTIQNVSNIAGLFLTKSGKKVAFTIMVNNFVVPTYLVTSFHDELIRYIWNNY